MWVYVQRSGALIDPDGKHIVTGYSGFGAGKNDPASEFIKGLGPVCCGDYAIGKHRNSENVGQYAMPLTPLPGTDTRGRSAFMIHGDSKLKPGQASHGCIVVPRHIREQIWNGGDHLLRVVSGLKM